MLRLLIASIIFFSAYGAAAQKIQGHAVYHRSVEVNFDMPSHKQLSEVDKQAMEAQLQKQFSKDFNLYFNNQASIYTVVEELDAQGGMAVSGGMMIKVTQGEGKLYKDIQHRNYAESKELFGKAFLVEDALELPQWELVEEFKEIQGQPCQKAVLTRIEEVTDLTDLSKTVKDTSEIVAWFAPQIPVGHGPATYWGLPGLLLEVQLGKTILTCTQLNLSLEEMPEIMPPTKGKKVSDKEFKQISQEKLKEMTKGFKGKGGKMIQIKTGG